jgi:hypothetical protein
MSEKQTRLRRLRAEKRKEQRHGYGYEHEQSGQCGWQVPRQLDHAVDQGLRRHMLRVYNYMALGLAI